MLSEKSYVFVDESGDSSVKVSLTGVSTHYVVAAVIVKGTELATAERLAEAIRCAHFQSGEMKSSGIGSKDGRRLRVLAALNEVPCSYYVFVVDKRRISKDSGLIFKKPFLKFLSRKVYERIFRTLQHVHIIADEHGNQKFMREFEDYVGRHHEPTLFENPEFSFSASHTSPLIQVADVVAGSVRRMFDAQHRVETPEEILDALGKKLVAFEEWPPVYHGLTEQISSAVSTTHDNLVREYCNQRVGQYLQRLNEENDEEGIREAVLLYLAHESRSPVRSRYISAPEIEAHLQTIGFRSVNHYELRSKIIAHFRDNGVIVASNASGYRIPTAVRDIASYVDRCQTMIVPMLARLRDAREAILMRSHNEIDILSGSECAWLKRVLTGLGPDRQQNLKDV